MKAIIPIGGRGTRMRPVTYSTNKHFIPVGNKMLIEYPIEAVVDAGIKDIAITYNPGQLEYAQEVLGNGSRWGAHFTYVLQEEPKGLSNIFQVCEEWVNGDRFVLHLGDNIFTTGIRHLVEYFLNELPTGLVAMVEHEENSRLGVPYFDENGRLTQYVEKPENPPHKYAVPGLYFLDSVAFDVFKGEDAIQPSDRGEYEIPSTYQWLIDHGYRVDVLEYKGTWLDPGKFGDWLETNQHLLDTKLATEINSPLSSTVKVEGRVKLGKNCVVEDSILRGPVSIGDNVTISNSFIGPYTSVNNNCKIDSCHIENSVLMEDVTLTTINEPIDTSLIGSHSVISSSNGNLKQLNLFVGENSRISL